MGLKLSIENSILFVEIDNAEAGYSFGPSEAKDLLKLLKSSQIKNIKGLVWLTPKDGIFCSGGNLKHYSAQGSRQMGIRTNREITKALQQLAQLALPTIAIVEGDCYGGGVELLSCFDYVVASPRAYFGLWQRRISLSFGWGGGARLLERMGLRKLKSESLLARSFSSYEAAHMGLIDKVLPSSLVQAEALKWLAQNQKRPQAPVKWLKLWMPQKERMIFEKLWFNKEHLEVLKKFKG